MYQPINYFWRAIGFDQHARPASLGVVAGTATSPEPSTLQVMCWVWARVAVHQQRHRRTAAFATLRGLHTGSRRELGRRRRRAGWSENQREAHPSWILPERPSAPQNGHLALAPPRGKMPVWNVPLAWPLRVAQNGHGARSFVQRRQHHDVGRKVIPKSIKPSMRVDSAMQLVGRFDRVIDEFGGNVGVARLRLVDGLGGLRRSDQR
jgi:hypothetical protein